MVMRRIPLNELLADDHVIRPVLRSAGLSKCDLRQMLLEIAERVFDDDTVTDRDSEQAAETLGDS